MTQRSNLPEIRNPVLALPAVKRLMQLSPSARSEIAEVLRELSLDARARAEESWRRHKAPMALYWKAVSVYAGHLARAVRQ
jgi:hypothetical protein